MSRQPSPGTSVSAQQTSYYRDAHGLPIEKGHLKIVYRGGDQTSSAQHQGASVPPPVATSSSSGRGKGRAYQSGIAAGAEDVKYAAKYRDLKQKVREIEADNDKLLFKVLQAKRNIQRAKLERAILYERLAELPASPVQGSAPLPPQHAGQGAPPAAELPRHADPRSYDRREHVPGSHAPHHRHSQHQQPIQPAPSVHVSPPQHHTQAHHSHHPAQDPAHPGQLPITHAQQVVTIQTNEGPLVVVVDPDGQPVVKPDGTYLTVQDMHAPSSSHHRKRGGRVSKEVREMREREAREIREREDIERKRGEVMLADSSSRLSVQQQHLEPPHTSSSSRSQNASMQGISSESTVPGGPQIAPITSREREREREWEVEREMRERERMQRRESREEERLHGHTHHTHHHRTHGHHHHQQVQERGRSPPPDSKPGLSPIQTSPPQPHRSHSQYSNHSHSSYGSHHGHGHGHHVHTHHSHSHSHSASPHSPGGVGAYPQTRVHGHQRVGPGSYVIRDRERADALAADQAAAAAASVGQGEEVPPAGTTAATGSASISRVPTPPYMQRSASSRVTEDPGSSAGTKLENAQPVEEGSGTRAPSSTPS